MLGRLVLGPLRLYRARLGVIVGSITAGAAIAGAFVGLASQFERQLTTEFRALGPNLVIEPEAARSISGAPNSHPWIEERDIDRLLTTYWRENYLALAPELESPVSVSKGSATADVAMIGTWFRRSVQRPGTLQTIDTGVFALDPYAELVGRGVEDESTEAVAGAVLARRLGLAVGDEIEVEHGQVSRVFRIVGIYRNGRRQDEALLVDLAEAQRMMGTPGRLSRLWLSARTVPLDAFGRQDPKSLTPEEYEKWICSPYITNIAGQIEQALPGTDARVIWPLEELQFNIIPNLIALMHALAILAVAAAALSAGTNLSARIGVRAAELAAMRQCGASAMQVTFVVCGELVILTLIGGVAGAIVAFPLANWISVYALGVTAQFAPIAPASAFGVAFAAMFIGAFGPVVRNLTRLTPPGPARRGA